MILLKNAEPGTTYTVKKVTGGRKNALLLANCGIAAGGDLTFYGLCGEKYHVVTVGGREFFLEPEYAETIQLTDQFKRGVCDPVFFSCCAYGKAGQFWDLSNKINDESHTRKLEAEQKEAAGSVQ